MTEKLNDKFINEFDIKSIDDISNESHYALFKKGSVLLYMGKLKQKSKGGILMAVGDKYTGQRELEARRFGFVVDFIEDEEIKCKIPLKKGMLVYADKYAGELVSYEKEEEVLFYKVIQLSEINLLIKTK